jgi:hypothetical protein
MRQRNVRRLSRLDIGGPKMLFLLAMPVVALVVLLHRLLQNYAPSNLLIARARASRPTFGWVAGLGGLALAVAFLAHGLAIAAQGGHGWLNLVAFVLCWDAIKFGVMACLTPVRAAGAAAHLVVQRSVARHRYLPCAAVRRVDPNACPSDYRFSSAAAVRVVSMITVEIGVPGVPTA